MATSANPIAQALEVRVAVVEAAQASIDRRLDRIEGLLWGLIIAVVAAIVPYFLGKLH